MKLLFTISAVIVLRSSASACPKDEPPLDALCQNPLGDAPNCSVGGWLRSDGVWVDGNGCDPLKKEVYCNNAPSKDASNTSCMGKCVVYAANGSHCKEDDIPTDTKAVPGKLDKGGFHPYPLCGSLDNDRTWGGFDENNERFDRNALPIQVVANAIESNSPGYANNNTKDKPVWLNNTNFVPGWYWCQAKEMCLHPQIAWTTDGRKIDMSKLDPGHAQACEGDGGNWKDHIFEAPEMGIFKPAGGCKDPDNTTDEYQATFNEVDKADYKHCTVFQLPVGNSYSGKSKTQCASGKVDRCSGAVAFYFSIAGFGHNYNFNFCLSTNGTDGERTNSWNNGISDAPTLRR